ncbi:hypothetical protein [Nostoc sp. WHI]|nr:hypothetical protein [Nostoc sp. WHI]
MKREYVNGRHHNTALPAAMLERASRKAVLHNSGAVSIITPQGFVSQS